MRSLCGLSLILVVACQHVGPAEPTLEPKAPAANRQSDEDAPTSPKAQPELAQHQATEADQSVTFDGMDAEAMPPETIQAAPKRQPIGRFKLFGEGPG